MSCLFPLSINQYHSPDSKDAVTASQVFRVRTIFLSHTTTSASGEHSTILQAHHRMVARRVIVVVALAIVSVFAFLLDLVTGPSSLTASQVLSELWSRGTLSMPQSTIVWELRLPQAAMAFLVGAALSLAGAEMQTILNNPLASPFTLGVSSAASFGAALAIIMGVSLPFVSADWMVPLNAFLCAFGSVLLLELISRRRAAGASTVVLFGIATAFTFNALVAFVQSVSSQEALQHLVFWSLGSARRSTWVGEAAMAVVLLVLLPFSMRAALSMTVLRMGEDKARSFGINVARLRFMSLMRISLLAGTAVAFVGTIGFIGLVGPHIARLLLGEDDRFLLPASALTGRLVLSLSSMLSKSLVPGVVLPVGMVPSVVGLPIFVVLIVRRQQRVEGGRQDGFKQMGRAASQRSLCRLSWSRSDS